MSVWTGWQKQLLDVAALPNSDDNHTFMSDWHSHATTNCTNNPVDISLNISGASACKLTSNPQHRARNYASHDQAAGQFAAQLRSGDYPHLLAALSSGAPYTPAGSDKVSADLATWGSSAFVTQYGKEINAQIAGGSVADPHTHKGWASVRRSMNQNMHATLTDSEKLRRRALQALARAHKVKI